MWPTCSVEVVRCRDGHTLQRFQTEPAKEGCCNPEWRAVFVTKTLKPKECYIRFTVKGSTRGLRGTKFLGSVCLPAVPPSALPSPAAAHHRHWRPQLCERFLVGFPCSRHLTFLRPAVPPRPPRPPQVYTVMTSAAQFELPYIACGHQMRNITGKKGRLLQEAHGSISLAVTTSDAKAVAYPDEASVAW